MKGSIVLMVIGAVMLLPMALWIMLELVGTVRRMLKTLVWEEDAATCLCIVLLAVIGAVLLGIGIATIPQ